MNEAALNRHKESSSMTRITQIELNALIQDITSLASLEKYEGCYTSHTEITEKTVSVPDYDAMARYNDRSSFDLAIVGDERFMLTETQSVETIIYNFDLSKILQKSGYSTFILRQSFPPSINSTHCDTNLAAYFQQATPEEKQRLAADVLTLIAGNKLVAPGIDYSLKEYHALFSQASLARLTEVYRSTHSKLCQDAIYRFNNAVDATRQANEQQEAWVTQHANTVTEEEKDDFKKAVLDCYYRKKDILTNLQISQNLSLFTLPELQIIYKNTSSPAKKNIIFTHDQNVDPTRKKEGEKKRQRAEAEAMRSTDIEQYVQNNRRQLSPDIASYFADIDVDLLTDREFYFNKLVAEKREFQRRNPGKLVPKLGVLWNQEKAKDLRQLIKEQSWKEELFPIGIKRTPSVEEHVVVKTPRLG
jgi:hypothetical protein